MKLDKIVHSTYSRERSDLKSVVQLISIGISKTIVLKWRQLEVIAVITGAWSSENSGYNSTISASQYSNFKERFSIVCKLEQVSDQWHIDVILWPAEFRPKCHKAQLRSVKKVDIVGH
jgi:hypothetical protein